MIFFKAQVVQPATKTWCWTGGSPMSHLTGTTVWCFTAGGVERTGRSGELTRRRVAVFGGSCSCVLSCVECVFSVFFPSWELGEHLNNELQGKYKTTFRTPIGRKRPHRLKSSNTLSASQNKNSKRNISSTIQKGRNGGDSMRRSAADPALSDVRMSSRAWDWARRTVRDRPWWGPF